MIKDVLLPLYVFYSFHPRIVELIHTLYDHFSKMTILDITLYVFMLLVKSNVPQLFAYVWRGICLYLANS